LRGRRIRRDERGNRGSETYGSFTVEGAPKRPESSREQEVPTRPKPSGSEEEHGLPDGIKPLKRRY
jgi:hypothetical protein